MSGYLRRIRDFNPDIKLFLLYNLLANVGFGVTELIFNLYLLELGFQEDYIGEWRAIQTCAMAAGSASVGAVLNRFGIWQGIVGGFSLLIAASVSLALTESATLLLGLAVLYGISLAFLFNPLMPFILEWAKPEHRQHAAAVSFSIVSLSLTIGSLVGGFSPSIIGSLVTSVEPGTAPAYRWALIIGAAIAGLGLVPLFLMDQPRRQRGRRETRAAHVEESHATRRQVRKDVAIFVAAGGVMSIGVGMVQPFYNVFLTRLGAGEREVGYVFALGNLTAAVMGLAAPALANRLGSLLAVAVLRVSIVPFYLPLVFFPSYPLAIVAHLARQVSISLAWPIDSTFIGELLPPRVRAGIYGLRAAAWNVGFAIASFAAGRIIVSMGYDLTFVAIITSTTVAALLFFGYYRRHPLVLGGKIPSALPRGSRAAGASGRAISPPPADTVEPEPAIRPASKQSETA